MSKTKIYENPGLVIAWWDDQLQALSIKWFTEYVEGSEVIEAVQFAIDYVNRNGIKNWFCDLSESKKALKPEDQLWVETEFKKAIANSTLEKVVLMPPLPETGQDIDWLDDWEANTKAEYKGQIDARLLSDKNAIRRFFES
jgi:hypothetical protein